MDDLTMWSLIVGALAPPVVAAIQQPKWSSRARALVTAVLSVVAGGVTAYLQGGLTGRTWVSSVLVVLVAALTTYRGLWQPTGVAPAIEQATSPTDTRA